MPYKSKETRRRYIREYNKRWRKANRLKANAIRRRYWQKHSVRLNKRRQTPIERARMRAYWRRTRQEQEVKRLQRLYGLTVHEYEALWQHQHGKCAICSREERGRKLAVDHNHVTGKVRALLCRACNCGLGNAEESIERLESMIAYLREHA